MSDPLICSRILGALHGSHLGDCIGACAEGVISIPDLKGFADAIRNGFRKKRFHEFPSQITDDSQLMSAVVEALSEKNGLDHADIAQRWIKLFSSGRIFRAGATTRAAVSRLASGTSFLVSGDPTGNSRGNGTILRSAPLAFYFHDRPDLLIKNVATLSRITHTHPESIAGAIAFSFFLRHLLLQKGEIDWESLTEDLAQKVADISPPSAEALLNIPQLFKMPREVLIETVRWFTDDSGHRVSYGGVQSCSLSTLLCSIIGFALHANDPIEAICFCIEAGGDTDSTAAIAGCISGAFTGVEAFPLPLLERIKDQNYANFEYFNDLSTRFADLVLKRYAEKTR